MDVKNFKITQTVRISTDNCCNIKIIKIFDVHLRVSTAKMLRLYETWQYNYGTITLTHFQQYRGRAHPQQITIDIATEMSDGPYKALIDALLNNILDKRLKAYKTGRGPSNSYSSTALRIKTKLETDPTFRYEVLHFLWTSLIVNKADVTTIPAEERPFYKLLTRMVDIGDFLIELHRHVFPTLSPYKIIYKTLPVSTETSITTILPFELWDEIIIRINDRATLLSVMSVCKAMRPPNFREIITIPQRYFGEGLDMYNRNPIKALITISLSMAIVTPMFLHRSPYIDYPLILFILERLGFNNRIMLISWLIGSGRWDLIERLVDEEVIEAGEPCSYEDHIDMVGNYPLYSTISTDHVESIDRIYKKIGVSPDLSLGQRENSLYYLLKGHNEGVYGLYPRLIIDILRKKLFNGKISLVKLMDIEYSMETFTIPIMLMLPWAERLLLAPYIEEPSISRWMAQEHSDEIGYGSIVTALLEIDDDAANSFVSMYLDECDPGDNIAVDGEPGIFINNHSCSHFHIGYAGQWEDRTGLWMIEGYASLPIIKTMIGVAQIFPCCIPSILSSLEKVPALSIVDHYHLVNQLLSMTAAKDLESYPPHLRRRLL